VVTPDGTKKSSVAAGPFLGARASRPHGQPRAFGPLRTSEWNQDTVSDETERSNRA